MKKVLICMLLLLTAVSVAAQEQEIYMGGSDPYDPSEDVDIDMYIGSWMGNPQYLHHTNFVARDVLTRCDGDPLDPPRKGAVLTYFRRFAHLRLDGRSSIPPTTLEHEQEIYYCLGGEGTVSGGGETFPVYPEVSFMIPVGLEFTVRNIGSEPLTFYMVSETLEKATDFTPNDYIVWHDEAQTDYDTVTAHWANCNKFLVNRDENLADTELILTVEILPGGFAEPHSHGEGVEEVWCAMDDVWALIGKEMRLIPAGTAYKIPPDDRTPHSHFNVTGEPIKFFYFARGWNNPK